MISNPSSASVPNRKLSKSFEDSNIICIFAPQIIDQYEMCVVDVKVDEAVLREVLPELDSTAAIRLWAQKVMDMHVQGLLRETKAERDMLQEKLWHDIELDSELLLKPSEIVDDDGVAVDLETFRADLHKMIEDVYAEP